jgi:hypothetical protein
LLQQEAAQRGLNDHSQAGGRRLLSQIALQLGIEIVGKRNGDPAHGTKISPRGEGGAGLANRML